MIYPIVLYGESVLKKRAENIELNDSGVKEVARDMYETMYQANGVGLAAPQIGKSERLFIIDSTPMEDNPENAVRQVFINAQMLEESGNEWAFEEGCLSIPGIREDVMRREKIKIRFYDPDWQLHEKEYEGVVARIIQHEYDHIEGILFTDHISPFKKRLLKSKLTNISKGKVNADYRVKVHSKK
jgi:peptide deformylase